jgi:hypothetical protein
MAEARETLGLATASVNPDCISLYLQEVPEWQRRVQSGADSGAGGQRDVYQAMEGKLTATPQSSKRQSQGTRETVRHVLNGDVQVEYLISAN